ncbi:hypothetical protein [uncultured Clostridium sp.]|uniref:hypothetical protein n=1 Tax=uncultured Clostridium sp. TaxID=59620 RepID=UPI0026290DFE|nr:hypothetical protein [uncultured Clostridium sp.]
MIALDDELKNMMVKVLEGHTRLESKVISIDDKLTGLETEVRKNSIKIETIGKHINIIEEEVQTSHNEE